MPSAFTDWIGKANNELVPWSEEGLPLGKRCNIHSERTTCCASALLDQEGSEHRSRFSRLFLQQVFGRHFVV
jgi:hypothetical protein